MRVRVKVRIIASGSQVTTSALVNSGFESEEPDICIPMEVARLLRLWPRREVESVGTFTAGGEVAVHILGSGRLQLLVDSEVKSEIVCNLMMNPYVDEVLLSDYVIDELGIIVVSFRRGLWRHVSDEPSIVRSSAEPEHW
ncbi:MAG: hypothetical protein DRN15_06380 [Thermoprotei archaeon]|nr:MAG: hypothetical protein DRN15_06380 [Thermoprotei archaeon]